MNKERAPASLDMSVILFFSLLKNKRGKEKKKREREKKRKSASKILQLKKYFFQKNVKNCHGNQLFSNEHF